jgi:hypothetical protein
MAVRNHINRITVKVRTTLQRQADTQTFEKIANRATVDAFAKTAILYLKLRHQGPPLHIALDWVGSRTNRAAVAALFGGDFFLGRYAGNYFAKGLLPGRRYHSELATSNLGPSRVCLHCWHYSRELHLEDESHVLFACPAGTRERRIFLSEVSDKCACDLARATTSQESLIAVFASQRPEDWTAFGKLIGRIRQLRRKMKDAMAKLSGTKMRVEFGAMKHAWKREGKSVCRHGVFFDMAQLDSCPCLSVPGEADWSNAVLMPALHPTLKCIVTDTFNEFEYRRLGVLQAEARRLRW